MPPQPVKPVPQDRKLSKPILQTRPSQSPSVKPGAPEQPPQAKPAQIREMPSLKRERPHQTKPQTAPLPTPSKPPGRPSEKKTPSADAELYAGVLPLSDGRLKVQAIVWSAKMEDRMAVVNDNVLYEGDTVEGFTVVSIREDDVVVREKGAGMWRVIFGRP